MKLVKSKMFFQILLQIHSFEWFAWCFTFSAVLLEIKLSNAFLAIEQNITVCAFTGQQQEMKESLASPC